MMKDVNEAILRVYPTGFGQSDTHIHTGVPYGTIGNDDIIGMVADPPTVPKERAQWIIPSIYAEYDAREHERQAAEGAFGLLVVDIDDNNLPLSEVSDAFDAVVPGTRRLIHSTRSSTPDDRRWRVMIPLAALLPGRDYKDTADAFYDLLEDASDDVLIPDRAAARPGQLVYLPNRGEHYEHLISKEGARLDLTDHPILARREETRRKRAEAEAAARAHREQKQRERASRTDDRPSPIEKFNADHSIEELLERHGYKRAGSSNDWRSPYQSSGSYAMGDYGDHWISLSGSDAANGVGRLTAGGHCHGDAFDLFVHFEHGGDFEKAVDSCLNRSTYSADTSDGLEWPGSDARNGQSADPDAPPKAKPKTAKNGGFRGIVTSEEFMAAMLPPEYLVDGLVEIGYAYSLTARTGHGKTLVGLLAAYGVAHSGLFGTRDVRRGSVLFLAGENPVNVRRQFYGLCRYHGVDPAALPIYWHEGSFDLDAGMDALVEAANRIPGLALVVADTLASFFTGEDFNNNNEMLETAKALRSISEKSESRPTVLCLAHPVKNASKDNLLPFGGSTIVNEFDGNLTLWSPDGETTTLHWQGKHRGAPFEPIDFKLKRFDPPGLVDARGRPMPMTIALPITTDEAEVKAKESERLENRALAAIKANPRVTERTLMALLNAPKSTVHDMLVRFLQEKWVRKEGRGRVLTPSGEAALDG
jgi:AAA domain